MIFAHDQIINDIENFGAQYGVYLSEHQKLLTFYNMANFYIHLVAMTGIPIPTFNQRKLFWAIAALHPTQDNYMDCHEPDKDALDLLRLRLSGVRCESSVGELTSVFKLIEIIYEILPEKHNPKLVFILTRLQDLQVLSLSQRPDGEPLEVKDLLNLSFSKGGYAFALFSYAIRGHLNGREFEYFFGMGGVFQLMDDLHDLDDDLKANSDTIFTRAVKENTPLDSYLLGLFEVQLMFEKETSEIGTFRFPSLVRLLEQFGFRYDTFRFCCMQEQYFTQNFWDSMKNRFPFDVSGLVEFYKKSHEHERLDVFRPFMQDLNNEINQE